MSFTSWLQTLRSALAPSRGQRHHRRRSSLRAATHRLNVEFLEDRCVPAQYALTPLGTLFDVYSYTVDLNEAGQVVGLASTADGISHALLWDNGTMIDLGTLGGSSSYARGINDLGQVVGVTALPGDATTHAFLVTPQGGAWFQDNDFDGRNDFMIDLGTFLPADINNAGQVVGSFDSHAFLWDAINGMTDLGVGDAVGINEIGQVTGPGFLWDAANGMTPLGAGPGYTGSTVTDINDAGQLAGVQWGSSASGGFPHAFRWTPDSPNGLTGNFTDLGVVPGASDSSAAAINNAGQVVGSSTGTDGWGDILYYAFVWDAVGGMVDLQEQVDPVYNVLLRSAHAINDGGAIVALGWDILGQQYSHFLLTPIPGGTPSIGIADAPAVMEGNAGTRAATFTVNLSEPSDQFVTVDFTTAAGSAAADSDYQTTSGTVTFAPGETSKTITVQVIGDRLVEPNESFVVNLSAPTNATIADGQGIGTILDDEPRISINDVTVTEGNTGAVNATFTVSLSAASDVAVTVHYQTASGSATAGTDYAAASGDVTIAAGQTATTFTALVIGDRSAEPTENFVVNLSAATNGLIVDSQGVGTILDDEPRIRISDVTRYEGRRNKTTLFTFTVTLSAAYDQAVTMSYRTVNGTATTADNDYIAKSGTLTFAPGETTKTITIEVKGDNKKEANEMFYVDLFGLSSNALFTKNRGLGTILNDD